MEKTNDQKFCHDCGKPISMRAEICPLCGVRQPINSLMTAPPGMQVEQLSPAANPKEKTIAVVLALFLGGLGFHKFYLGRVGWGVVYLLLCWTFVPAIIALLEGLNYLFMSQATFKQRYPGEAWTK